MSMKMSIPVVSRGLLSTYLVETTQGNDGRFERFRTNYSSYSSSKRSFILRDKGLPTSWDFVIPFVEWCQFTSYKGCKKNTMCPSVNYQL